MANLDSAIDPAVDPVIEEDMSLSAFFRPPTANHTFGVLNRALFNKTVTLAGAAVTDKKKIAQWRNQLQKDNTLITAERVPAVVFHPNATLAEKGARCILLDPKVRPDVRDTWSPLIRDAVQKQELDVIPYKLILDYDFWTYEDVMRCLLPPELRDEHDGFPSGFNQAGHIAHLNLRERYLPYKKLIAEVLVDKNPKVTTVINKIADVGAESEFRTFNYEVLAGSDDLKVEARENESVYSFDYAKVYWNSKLEAEHRRIAWETFKPGEAVCDLMAGIGPFAIPAARRGVFVWANDYNPESYRFLKKNIERNKVSQWVRPFNEDGRVFIRKAADLVYEASVKGEEATIDIKKLRRASDAAEKKPQQQQQKTDKNKTKNSISPQKRKKRVPVPPTISHFVMNLPGSATTFLPHFRGLYAGREDLFEPHPGGAKLPLIHVYGFVVKTEGSDQATELCERISAELGATITPGADPENTPGVASVYLVRAVAPKKDMFCASFRIPAEVAFAPSPVEGGESK
ncbi:Met-10+ like-protein-domain-containing protein [Xylariaceae sp. FL0594]|nr:Met-10+ like-protein-domain-containing protein [Xylariaceae sp. FL0594]